MFTERRVSKIELGAKHVAELQVNDAILRLDEKARAQNQGDKDNQHSDGSD